jgi:thioredoxin 1
VAVTAIRAIFIIYSAVLPMMTDSPSSERERIREQKRQALLDEHDDGSGENDAGPEETPDTPIEIESREHFERVTTEHEAVLVDCYADWCGPCQAMEPTVEAIAADADAAVAKLDIDAHQQLAAQLGVRGVPTFVLFVGGEPTERLVGAQDRATLEGLLGRA